MKSTRTINSYLELMSTLDAAVGSDQLGTSNSQGPNPLHYLLRHGGVTASIMDDLIPMPTPAEFGSYENYLAARVDGVRAARGTSRLEVICHFAEIDEDEDGGKDSVTIGKTRHFANLSTGSLRELHTGLWDGRVWEEICEVAVFTANKADFAAHGLKPKALSTVARAVVDKLLTGNWAQQDEGAAASLGDDLEGEAQSDAAEQGFPGAQGPYSVAKRAPGGTDPPAGPASKGNDDDGPQHRTAQAPSTRRPRRAPPRRVAGRRCSNPRPAPA